MWLIHSSSLFPFCGIAFNRDRAAIDITGEVGRRRLGMNECMQNNRYVSRATFSRSPFGFAGREVGGGDPHRRGMIGEPGEAADLSHLSPQ